MARPLLNVIRVLALRGLGVAISLATVIGITLHFGAGPLTDAFFLVRRMFGSIVLLVESLCNALLVPGFVQSARSMDQASYLKALRRREMAFFACGAVLATLLILTAPTLVTMMAPALSPEARDASIAFLAMMALTVPITLSTAFVGSSLNAIRRFSLPVAIRLAPRILILLAVLLVPLGMGMTGIVLAAVLGHVVMLLALWLVRRRISRVNETQPLQAQEKPAIQTESPARVAALTILAVYFLAVIISESYMASFVGVGAIAILGLGQRISTLGVSELLSSVLVVYYTNFAEKADDAKALAAEMRGALASGYFFTTPITLCMAVLAPSIAQLILAQGAFSSDDAAQAGALVAWFAMAAFVNTGMSIFETAILARSERRKIWHMVRACSAAFILRLVVMVILLPAWGLGAIGAAAVVGPIVIAVFHHHFLSRQIGSILLPETMRTLAKIAGSGLLCVGLCFAVQAAWPWQEGKIMQALMLFAALGLGLPAYLLACAWLGVKDAKMILFTIAKRLRRRA